MADRTPRPPLDEAIDRAVRDIMNADARPGFERRVMKRLSEPVVRRVAWPRLAAASAALAVIIVAALLLRGAPERASETPAGHVASTPPSSQTSPAPPSPPAGPSTVTVDAPRARTTRAPGSSPVDTADLVADQPPVPMIAALQGPSALDVENIPQRPVNVPDIKMPSIEIDELTVEPLRPSEGREE